MRARKKATFAGCPIDDWRQKLASDIKAFLTEEKGSGMQQPVLPGKRRC